MRAFCAFLLAGAACAGDAPAPPGDANEALLARLSALAGSVRTVQGTCTWRTFNPDHADPAVALGSFALEVPDHYNLKRTKPGAEGAVWLRSDGKTRWEVEQVFDDTKPETTARHPAGDGDADIRRILGWVRGDLTLVRQEFTVAATETAGGFELTLVARPEAAVAADVARARLRYDRAGHVQAVVFEQPSGTRIEIAVDSAQYDQPIPPETFRVAEP